MSYLVRNMCYADLSSAYADMAAHCPVADAYGNGINCVPTSSGYQVLTTAPSGTVTTATVNLTPVSCVPETADTYTLAVEVSVALVTAWAIKMLARAF